MLNDVIFLWSTGAPLRLDGVRLKAVMPQYRRDRPNPDGYIRVPEWASLVTLTSTELLAQIEDAVRNGLAHFVVADATMVGAWSSARVTWYYRDNLDKWTIEAVCAVAEDTSTSTGDANVSTSDTTDAPAAVVAPGTDVEEPVVDAGPVDPVEPVEESEPAAEEEPQGAEETEVSAPVSYRVDVLAVAGVVWDADALNLMKITELRTLGEAFTPAVNALKKTDIIARLMEAAASVGLVAE
jgi:hypothetical protein